VEKGPPFSAAGSGRGSGLQAATSSAATTTSSPVRMPTRVQLNRRSIIFRTYIHYVLDENPHPNQEREREKERTPLYPACKGNFPFPLWSFAELRAWGSLSGGGVIKLVTTF